MADKFLHGVEVLEIDAGPRPIRTVRTGVIGIVGTAPDAAADTKATLRTGTVGDDSALDWTAKSIGALGNLITVAFVDPGSADAALAVAVSGNAISVSLATDAEGAVTSTAAEVLAAIEAETDADALVSVVNAGGSDGSGVVAPAAATALAGGEDEPFPLNKPVLVAGSRREAGGLDNVGNGAGTLPAALDGIFDQIGAVVIVVRVDEGSDETEALANVLGGTNAQTDEFEGVHALLSAESVVGYAPKILCAPGFTSARDGTANTVVAELAGIAERLRAVIIADGPSTTDAAAITYGGDFGDDRIYVVDPAVKVAGPGGTIKIEPASARVAGLIAKVDNDRGFWWSPSNQLINGIVGTERSVDFKMGDANSRANLLNEAKIATIIRHQGYRLWGNRSLSDDPKFHFLSTRRIADALAESLQRSHLWACDRNITKTYIEDVTAGVNAYIRSLINLGALLGGECWPDPDLNTPVNIAAGKVFFNFDFTPPYPAEHITFRSHLVDTYISEALS